MPKRVLRGAGKRRLSGLGVLRNSPRAPIAPSANQPLHLSPSAPRYQACASRRGLGDGISYVRALYRKSSPRNFLRTLRSESVRQPLHRDRTLAAGTPTGRPRVGQVVSGREQRRTRNTHRNRSTDYSTEAYIYLG